MFSSKIFLNNHCTVKNKQPPKPTEAFIHICLSVCIIGLYVFIYVRVGKAIVFGDTNWLYSEGQNYFLLCVSGNLLHVIIHSVHISQMSTEAVRPREHS